MKFQYCYVAKDNLTAKRLAISVLANNKKDANKIVEKIKKLSKNNDVVFFERVTLNKEQKERFKNTTIEEQLNLITEDFEVIKILKTYKADNLANEFNEKELKEKLNEKHSN